MYWVLIGIAIATSGDHISSNLGIYEDMIDCFKAREKVLVEIGAFDGFPPPNIQMVCIQAKLETL